MPFVPFVPPSKEEINATKEANEYNADRDGLRNGTQDAEEIVVVDATEINNNNNNQNENENIGSERILYQKILIKCDQHFSTGLHRASAMGDIDLVRAMCGELSVTDLDYEDPEGTTPLMRASYHGHADVVRMLVESGATIDLENSRGRTAMMEAVIQNHPSVVWELMMLGGEYTRPNRFKQIPLNMAIRYDRPNDRSQLHVDEFGEEYTTMELVTDVSKLRNEHKKLL